MSQSTNESAPEIETWSKEDIHHWLMTEVKVPQSCADIFIKEEVSGEELVDYEKQNILDLGIKHGPAVKITSYLKSLKEGTQHKSQFPADVENWTKEQVTQWLLQHVKVDDKKAERFQEEDVSGDCLVCFSEQDFVDMELKKGPAGKIMKQLLRLKNEESALQPVSRPFRWSLRDKNKQESTKPKPSSRATKSKETTENPAPLIRNTLDELSTEDRKSFNFTLQLYTASKCKPIPKGKLEGKDSMDIATLVTNHYGHEEALRITRDILQTIHQCELASKLVRYTDQEKLRCTSCDDEEDTEDSEKSDSSSRSRRKPKKGKEQNRFRFQMNMKIDMPCCK
ncbi:uncharacterized protein LOC125896001 [Epinephelus fuscoguttatus]|uniref:uncharacterized protein LOC125896001 n=1 Tax=Epinephelus fuscoguttatus TaxID=293821 RepID=UPI0020D1AD49|nr:uncharacterized protein LOC125896001 [Epinephelus fuscoguttatus]XP_049444232.1 uncharacterized protein LOC125896001 [Epinephelus fuscoguttatus]